LEISFKQVREYCVSNKQLALSDEHSFCFA